MQARADPAAVQICRAAQRFLGPFSAVRNHFRPRVTELPPPPTDRPAPTGTPFGRTSPWAGSAADGGPSKDIRARSRFSPLSRCQLDNPLPGGRLPIGSGSTKSANKVVVEARLKGSGMHWARVHVDPLVALRRVTCANGWGETWPRIAARLRTDANGRRRARWHTRHPVPAESPATVPPQSSPILAPVAAEQTAAPRRKSVINGRPTAFHSWKRPLCLAGRRS
jgi:hypothetical protein